MYDICLPRMGKSSRRIEEPVVALVALVVLAEAAAGMAGMAKDGADPAGRGSLRRVALDIPGILGRFRPSLPL
jgi:hypothetical protein